MLKASSPSIGQKIDLAGSWRTAVRITNRELNDYGEPPLATETRCPFTLDELLAEDFDVEAALARLRP